MELNESSLDAHLARPSATGTHGSRASARRASHPFGARALRATAILIGLAFAVTVYGVAMDRDVVAVIGLVAVALAVAAMALGARASIRTLARRCEVLGRARAESERARHDLELENAELERRNTDLEARQAAILNGFDWVDEQTAGRLSALLEAAGLELADRASEVLDKREEDV